MPTYKCPDCDKTFDRKSNYDYHVYKRQRSCVNKEILKSLQNPKADETNEIIETFECPKCGKKCSRKDSLVRHMKLFCKGKQESNIQEPNTQESQESKKSTEKKLTCKFCGMSFRHSSSHNRHERHNCPKNTGNVTKPSKNKISELESMIKAPNNVDNATSNCNVVNITAFGYEDLYAIDDKTIKLILKKGYQSILALIKHTHFNEDHPELHNVFISNIKSPYANVFDGQKWILADKDDIVNRLFDNSQCLLLDRFKELFHVLPPVTKKKFQRFKMEVDKDTIDGIKHDINLMLYNDRHIPMKTKNRNATSLKLMDIKS